MEQISGILEGVEIGGIVGMLTGVKIGGIAGDFIAYIKAFIEKLMAFFAGLGQ